MTSVFSHAGAATAALALVSACSSTSPAKCGGPVCPFVSYGAALDSANVTWGLDTTPVHAASVSTGVVSAGNCQVAVPSDSDFSNTVAQDLDASSAAAQGPLPTSIGVTCNNGPIGASSAGMPGIQSDYVVTLEGLGDPRTWTVGTFTVPGLNHYAETYSVASAASAGTCCDSCAIARDGIAITVVVEEAVGGSVSTPPFVSADYRRVFRVEVDTTSAPVTRSQGTCTRQAQMAVSLHFVQTVSDFAYHPDQPCTPCE